MDQKKIEFWNKKIISWESQRYKFNSSKHNALENRLLYAKDFLIKHGLDQNIVDVGCGSGKLFELLDQSAFKQLMGVDFSAAAIRQASEKFSHFSNIRFLTCSVKQIPWEQGQVFTALGLLDWLDPHEIKLLLSQLKHKKFLISFSNKNPIPLRIAHQFFVLLTYGWRDTSYRPKYYSKEELQNMCNEAGLKNVEFHFPKKNEMVAFIARTSAE